jgi:GTP-binding protein HflX
MLECVGEHLRKGSKVRKIRLAAAAGEAIAWLYANGEVIGQQSRDLETEYEVRMSDADWARFQTHYLQAAG